MALEDRVTIPPTPEGAGILQAKFPQQGFLCAKVNRYLERTYHRDVAFALGGLRREPPVTPETLHPLVRT